MIFICNSKVSDIWSGHYHLIMTRFTYKYLRPIALFLSIVVLFQCCKVYYKEPVSVDEAVHHEIKKVKIITIDDRELMFDSIYYKEDKLYGLLTAKKSKSEVLVKEESIKEIFLFNANKSTGLTGLLIIGIPVGIVLFMFIACALDEDCRRNISN